MTTDDNNSVALGRRRFFKTMSMGVAAGALGLAASNARSQSAQPHAASNEVLDVIVIGAGIAGLTAARDLKRAGLDAFVVLEARDRVGGRVYNHDLGEGVISEAGGQWIGPGQTAIYDLARELNIDTFKSYYQGKSVYLGGNGRFEEDIGHGGVALRDEILNKINTLAASVPAGEPWLAERAAELDKMTVGDWLAQFDLTAEEKLGFDGSMSLTYGATPANLGLLHYLSFINSANCDLGKLEAMEGGAQESRFIGGSQLLCTRMAEMLGGHIQLSTPVLKIIGWDKPVVEVHTATGVYRARQIIMALNPALCHQIGYSPVLPEGRRGLQHYWPAHAPMRKTVHVYDKPFWRDAGYNGQILPFDGPLLWSYDNSPPDGSVGVLSAFIKPGQLPSAKKEAEGILSKLYAKALGDKALRPIDFHDYDWGQKDRWSLTCISPIPPGFWTRRGKYLKPTIGKLIWSGTETADLWPGAMDGAVRSGHKAALEALHSLSLSSSGQTIGG